MSQTVCMSDSGTVHARVRVVGIGIAFERDPEQAKAQPRLAD